MSVANATYTRTNSLGPSEARSYPRFFIEAVRDDNASRLKGRDIFREEERVEIIMPGNPYTRPIMRVAHEHREMWPKEYAAFKAGQEVAIDGTPLEAWARLRPHQLYELKALGFKTVEQVAHMDDRAIALLGASGRRLREFAQGFMSDSARAAALERLAAENDVKSSEVEDLKLKLKTMQEAVDRLSAKHEVAPRTAVRSALDAFADAADDNNPVDDGETLERQLATRSADTAPSLSTDTAAASHADRGGTLTTKPVVMPNLPNPRRRLGKHEGVAAEPKPRSGANHCGDETDQKLFAGVVNASEDRGSR